MCSTFVYTLHQMHPTTLMRAKCIQCACYSTTTANISYEWQNVRAFNGWCDCRIDFVFSLLRLLDNRSVQITKW